MKNFLTKIRLFFAVIFGLVPKDWRTSVKEALRITTMLKAFLDSPVAELVTALTPTRADDVIRQKLLDGLGRFAQFAQLIEDAVDIHDPATLVAHIRDKLAALPVEVRNMYLHKAASFLARHLAGNDPNFKERLADLLVQLQYNAAKTQTSSPVSAQ